MTTICPGGGWYQKVNRLCFIHDFSWLNNIHSQSSFSVTISQISFYVQTLNRYLCTTLDWLLKLSCVLSSVCLAWFAFGEFFVSNMTTYSCTTLDWLLRISSVCFWRVPLWRGFAFGVFFCFSGLNPPRVSTGGVTDTLTQNDHNKDFRASGVPPEELKIVTLTVILIV